MAEKNNDTAEVNGKPVKILTLHLKKEWFEKIMQGKKTVEYREVKPHYINMLCRKKRTIGCDPCTQKECVLCMKGSWFIGEKEGGEPDLLAQPYTHVRFILGYPKKEDMREGVNMLTFLLTTITIEKPEKGMVPEEWEGIDLFAIRFTLPPDESPAWQDCLRWLSQHKNDKPSLEDIKKSLDDWEQRVNKLRQKKQ